MSVDETKDRYDAVFVIERVVTHASFELKSNKDTMMIALAEASDCMALHCGIIQTIEN